MCLIFCSFKLSFEAMLLNQVQARKELSLIDSTQVISLKDDIDVMMMTLLHLIKANIMLLPLSIHLWLWEKYHPLGEPMRPGGSEGSSP